MDDEEQQTEELFQRVRSGNESALAELFSQHRQRLHQIVSFRLDRRLGGRVDAEDILQEAYIDAASRIHHFKGENLTAFFIWLRLVVLQTLTDVHRRHMGAQMRDATREVPIHRGAVSQNTSISLAAHLIGQLTSPSHAVMRDEKYRRLEGALEKMDAIDREILALRHFEELSNWEVAEALGIQQKAASQRYVRALKRLKRILSDLGDFSDA